MKTNSIGKSFTIEKILKIGFQNFLISWKASKYMSWTFLGSLHEMLWKKYFTVYPGLKTTFKFQLNCFFWFHCVQWNTFSKETASRVITLSWRRPMSYRNQSIDLRSISASVMKGLRKKWFVKMKSVYCSEL